MAGRTFAVGDIHGELEHLFALLSCFPKLDRDDTLVFLGDYVDRGAKSAHVIDYIRRRLPTQTAARVIALRGNHEDAWLKVVAEGWPGFVLPPDNGCLATMLSYTGGQPPPAGEMLSRDDTKMLMTGAFFPTEVVEWMHALPYWYEDDHAIYVHAGLPKFHDRWPHPSELDDKTPLLWIRTMEFFQSYRGKRVIFGHTTTAFLPQELSSFTPDDPNDLFAGENVIGIDTGCGNGGFLTAIELPAMHVYESRNVQQQQLAVSPDSDQTGQQQSHSPKQLWSALAGRHVRVVQRLADDVVAADGRLRCRVGAVDLRHRVGELGAALGERDAGRCPGRAAPAAARAARRRGAAAARGRATSPLRARGAETGGDELIAVRDTGGIVGSGLAGPETALERRDVAPERSARSDGRCGGDQVRAARIEGGAAGRCGRRSPASARAHRSRRSAQVQPLELPAPFVAGAVGGRVLRDAVADLEATVLGPDVVAVGRAVEARVGLRHGEAARLERRTAGLRGEARSRVRVGCVARVDHEHRPEESRSEERTERGAVHGQREGNLVAKPARVERQDTTPSPVRSFLAFRSTTHPTAHDPLGPPVDQDGHAGHREQHEVRDPKGGKPERRRTEPEETRDHRREQEPNGCEQHRPHLRPGGEHRVCHW
jgi:serine/threonine protein phosphatase 1